MQWPVFSPVFVNFHLFYLVSRKYVSVDLTS